jgi:nucleoporin NDC1
MEYSKHKKRCCDSKKKQVSPLYAKACAMADVLRNSIYGIMSVFHEKMLTSTKTGLLDKDWVTKSNPLFGTYKLLVQKLHHFLDFQAS